MGRADDQRTKQDAPPPTTWTDCTGQQGAEATLHRADDYWPPMTTIELDAGSYTSDDLRGLAAWLMGIAEVMDVGR